MDKQVVQWLADYVVMMEANLGTIQSSKIEGLYDCIVERIVEVRSYLKQHGWIIMGRELHQTVSDEPHGDEHDG